VSGPAGGGDDGRDRGDSAGTATPREIRLCLLGFGNVARAFCALLDRQAQALARDDGLVVLISAVGTRRGSLIAPEGLAPAEVLAAVGGLPAPPQSPLPAGELLAGSQADVLVELTVMEEGSAAVATGHIESAFRLGMDVITANKGPIAWSWPRISSLACDLGRRIRFESTVIDGLPVFGLLDFALPHCRLLGFQAVFNATTNAIIEAIGAGAGFEAGLARARADGFAEADPSKDIDGWDAASKAAALANVAMGAAITPADVERQSLRDVDPAWIAAAHAAGRRLRLVTEVWREPADGRDAGEVRGRIRARELEIDHPLAAIGGRCLGVVLSTDLMSDVLVAELDGLLPQTAYGVYADLLHIVRGG
jgi:homoserine dehydrogenase